VTKKVTGTTSAALQFDGEKAMVRSQQSRSFPVPTLNGASTGENACEKNHKSRLQRPNHNLHIARPGEILKAATLPSLRHRGNRGGFVADRQAGDARACAQRLLTHKIPLAFSTEMADVFSRNQTKEKIMTKPIPDGFNTLTPHIIVQDAAKQRRQARRCRPGSPVLHGLPRGESGQEIAKAHTNQ
jgi:hypothetical protein